LRVRCDLSVTVNRPGTLKGTLTLGTGDTLRLELEGKPFGEAVKSTVVNDGAKLTFTDSGDPKKNRAATVPQALGAHCRASLPRLGVFLLWYRLDQNLGLDPDQFTLSDFKLAGKETIGARTTQVIQYTAREKGNTPRLAMKL